LEPRQIARVAMKQSVGATAGGTDVAMAVNDEEGIAVFQRTPRPCRRMRRWNIKWRFRRVVGGRRIELREACSCFGNHAGTPTRSRHSRPLNSFNALVPPRCRANRRYAAAT